MVLPACALVGIGVVAFWPGEREPEYNGKRLSEWVQPYTWNYDDVEDDNPVIERKRTVADEALQHMGTNALHWLVRWVAYERPAWKSRIGRIVWKIPAKPIRYWYIRDDQLRSDARDTLVALGTNAVAVVPELARIVRTSRNADAQDAAMWVLGQMGKNGFPPLLAALDDKKTSLRAAACIVELSKSGVDVGSAIPGLLLMDRGTDEQVRRSWGYGSVYHDSSYYALPELLGANRPFLIPALTSCLHHTDSDVRVEAAKALGSLHDKARPAVPALKEALDDRVVAVQEAALDAFEKIAPEVLTNGAKDF